MRREADRDPGHGWVRESAGAAWLGARASAWPRGLGGIRASRESAVLAVAVVVASSVDAALTLLHVQAGGGELNPLMAAVLAHGVPFFVGVKTLGTAAGALFLALEERSRLARAALRSAAAVYALVLAYHGFLLAL